MLFRGVGSGGELIAGVAGSWKWVTLRQAEGSALRGVQPIGTWSQRHGAWVSCG